MATSTTDINNPNSKVISSVPVPIAASTQIVLYQHVSFNSSGYLVPSQDSAGLIPFGYSITSAAQGNNTGANGAITGNVVPYGVGDDNTYWVMATTGATQAWCGGKAYFLTDTTVAQTGGVSNNIEAGVVVQIYSSTSILVAMHPAYTR